jgi:putative hydrolase of the HAD superfamily
VGHWNILELIGLKRKLRIDSMGCRLIPATFLCLKNSEGPKNAMHLKYKALLIDFDGTLIDSEIILFESWSKVYASFGVQLELEFWVMNLRACKPHYSAYSFLCQCLDEPPPLDIAQSLQRRFETELMQKSHLRPGMRELLMTCKNIFGLKTAIVTSSTIHWISPHINRQKIVNLIDLLVTRESVQGKKKPDPTCFVYALEQLGCKPEEAIAIEDSPWGISASKKAGIQVIAFPNKITKSMDMSSSDVIIANGVEVIEYLKSGLVPK